MLEGVETLAGHAWQYPRGAKSRSLRAGLNNMFRRTTAVARYGLPRIFEVDLYPIG